MHATEKKQPMAAGPSRYESWRMFDRIAHRYDLLNRLLSGGRDRAWRKRMLSLLPAGSNLEVLDLACGTGDVLLSLAKGSERVKSGIGLDMSAQMLRIGAKKIKREGLSEKLQLIRGDASAIPAPTGAFDTITIAFGIRNVIDVPAALSEIYRCLKPGGKALILEFSLPRNRLIRAAYLIYFRKILPLIGGIISGDNYAYRYLNETVESFPYGEAFGQLMKDAGFDQVDDYEQTSGVATIYVGEKSNPKA